MENTNTINVETYNLKAQNGRHIRKATRVIFEDGRTINFMERMSKKEAIRQATELRIREGAVEFVESLDLPDWVKADMVREVMDDGGYEN